MAKAGLMRAVSNRIPGNNRLPRCRDRNIIPRMSALVRWRQLCEQWRHCYLLLAVAFAAVLRLSALATPNLQNARFRGGLHPLDVLMLTDILPLVWIPFLAVF